MKITLIGCGAWAMGIASHLARKDFDVTVWAHSEAEADRLNREKSLPNVFPGVIFPESIRPVHCLSIISETPGEGNLPRRAGDLRIHLQQHGSEIIHFQAFAVWFTAYGISGEVNDAVRSVLAPWKRNGKSGHGEIHCGITVENHRIFCSQHGCIPGHAGNLTSKKIAVIQLV